MSDLVLKWTCSGADPAEAGRLDAQGELRERVHDFADADQRDGWNLVLEAVSCHPEPDRVHRLMAMNVVYVGAWELADGDVVGSITPRIDVTLAEARGITRMPNALRRRPQG
jgi:hypothetical protein